MYYLDFYREKSSNLFSSALLCYNKGESVKEKSEKSGRKAQTDEKEETKERNPERMVGQNKRMAGTNGRNTNGRTRRTSGRPESADGTRRMAGRKAQTERKYEKERANGRACQKDNR